MNSLGMHSIGILIVLSALAAAAIGALVLKTRAKRFKNSQDWQRHERKGGGS